MTLRTRLFVTSLVAAVPLAVALFLIGQRLRVGPREEELRRSVEFDLSNGLADRCNADPPRTGRPGFGGGRLPGRPPARGGPFGAPPPDEPAAGGPPGPRPGGPANPPRGRGNPYEFFAYDASGRASSDDAPPLPPDHGDTISGTYWSGTGLGVSLVVPIGGTGPCAFVLARIPPPPGEFRDQLESLALVVLSVLATTWLAAGPVITKLRRLGDGVRRSAASHYTDPVDAHGRDEVATLATAFNEAGALVRAHLDDVQAREQALRAFVADTTHDVAIPLTVLQGHLADLEQRVSSATEAERVRAAMQEAHYMASLLRNLAAATRLDEWNAPLTPTPVDLSALVERVVARHRPVARTLGVEINAAVPDPPLVAPSDHTLLEQALSNLVDNAVRYNHPGGHVAVVLDRTPEGFVLTVQDDGPGVTDEELALLTTRWFRGSDARTRRPDGKGLGLAIVSACAQRLGLTLTFTRPPDGGLCAALRYRTT